MGILLTVIGSVVAGVLGLALQELFARHPVPYLRKLAAVFYPDMPSRLDGVTPEEAARRRAERLSRSLLEAVDLIQEIEGDLNAGQGRIEKLKREIDIYERMAHLSKDEAKAVKAVLNEGRGRERWVTRIENFAMNAFFFGLGVFVTMRLTD